MAVRQANAVWQGDLRNGKGTIKTESGALDGAYSFGSRFVEDKEKGTNPDELLGAALASCYAMALSNMLAGDGHTPERVAAEARVHLQKSDGGFEVPKIELICEATVPGIDRSTFMEHARAAKDGCPISKTLKVEITLEATLKN